jgi:hypothetical protein
VETVKVFLGFDALHEFGRQPVEAGFQLGKENASESAYPPEVKQVLLIGLKIMGVHRYHLLRQLADSQR